MVQNDSYSPEDYDLFQTSAQKCIEEGDGAQVMSIIVDEKNKSIARCMGWGLVGPLVHLLVKREGKTLPHIHAILSHLLEICSPKELLVGLLEQVESADVEDISATVMVVVQPLQKVLLNLGVKKSGFIGMALSTLLNQVARLPESSAESEQEDKDSTDFGRCCLGLLRFLRPFAEEARLNCHSGTVHDEELRMEILKFCMRSLMEPFFQITDPDQLETSFQYEFITEILAILTGIREPLQEMWWHKLQTKRQTPGSLEEEVRYPEEALANLTYLLFVHHIGTDHFPAVLSPVYTLKCNMEHINFFLMRTEESFLHRGLALYEKCLNRVEDESLSVELLELKTFIGVPQNLVKVMTLCPVHQLRSKSLTVFQSSINKFSIEAKYKFLRCMFRTCHHSGVEGFIIKNIKNLVDFSLKPGNENVWFQGINFLPLLHTVVCLPQGPETDLLQNLDRIMESLNLLRYLLLKDKECDHKMGIWSEVPYIQEDFLKPLRLGLNMSKAHYEAELKNRTSQEGRSEISCQVSVGNETLQNLSPELQNQALHSALLTFQLIESVLVRLEEIAEDKP